METISGLKEVKANKEHLCAFCGGKILKGDTYATSTHKHDGMIYDWKTHIYCSDIASRLKMYENCDECLTRENFQETIHSEYFDLIVSHFSTEDQKKYSDVIQQLHYVRFKDKLRYVIRHYTRVDKEANPKH